MSENAFQQPQKAVEQGASLVEMSRGPADEASITELLHKCELGLGTLTGTSRYYVSVLQVILRAQLS